MPSMNVFEADEFGLTNLTNTVNDQPFVPGRAAEFFDEADSINTVDAWIDRSKEGLALVQSSERGTDPDVDAGPTRDAVALKAIRIARTARITADELQGLRAFGTESELETVQGLLGKRQKPVLNKIDATVEWHRMGALKGLILDADGSPLVDLRAKFGIGVAPAAIEFKLDAASPAKGAVAKLCRQIVRNAEDKVGNAPISHVHALVGSNFFDGLVDHKEVREAFERQRSGAWMSERKARRSVEFEGVVFEEYRGKVGDADFVGTDGAEFFPVLSSGSIFKEVYAPGDRMEVVNTLGMPRYAFPYIDPKGRFFETELQTNVITYCSMPQALASGVAGTNTA